MSAVLGANWLARAGVLVLALGVVFFLKLAYDRNWVPLTGRFAIGVTGGLALAVTGDLLRRRRIDAAFTQVLAAGGCVITYVTVYLGYAFTDYRAALHLTLGGTLALLALVAAGITAYALWRNLPTLAGVAVVLALAVIAPAGDLSTAGVYYVGLLTCGLLGGSAWRRWDAVILSGLFGANVALLVAGELELGWTHVLGTALAVNAVGIAAAHRSRFTTRPYGELAAALAIAATVLQAGVSLTRADVADSWGWSTLTVGTTALALAVASRPLARVAGLAAALLLLAWPSQHFTGTAGQIIAYAGLAAAAAVASLAWSRGTWALRLASSAAVALGAGSLLWIGAGPAGAATHAWTMGLLACTIVGEALALWLLGKPTPAPQDEPAQATALAAAGLVLVAWPYVQFPDTLWQAATLVAAAAGLSAWAWAKPARSRAPKTLAAVTLLSALASLAYLAVRFGAAHAHSWAAGGAALAAVAVAVTAFVAPVRRRDDEWEQGASWLAFGVAGVLAVAWPFIQFPGDAWQTVTLGMAAAASVGLAAVAPRRNGAFAWLGAAVAMVALVSLAALGGNGLLQPSPAVAAVATLLLMLVGGTLWWRNQTLAQRPLRIAGLAATVLAPGITCVFLLDGWQVAVAWAFEAVALVVAALALHDDDVRLASFAGFAAVLVHIFAVDLATLDLAFKVLTFVLTGALLLVGAFLYARQRRGPSARPPATPPS